MDHEEEDHDTLEPEPEAPLLHVISFYLALLIVLPLKTVLRVIEAIGVLCVGFGAGLLAFSIFGLYSSGLRSVPMWGLLAVSITIPTLYFKMQIDSDAISNTRSDVVADKIYGFLKKKLGIGESNDQDHA